MVSIRFTPQCFLQEVAGLQGVTAALLEENYAETKLHPAEFDGNKIVPECDTENDGQATSRS